MPDVIITDVHIINSSNGRELKEVIIPDSVTSISTDAFRNCKTIVSVVIPSSVTNMGSYVFSGCDKLRDIYCAASRKPSGWNDDWSSTRFSDVTCYPTITWGYQG